MHCKMHGKVLNYQDELCMKSLKSLLAILCKHGLTRDIGTAGISHQMSVTTAASVGTTGASVAGGSIKWEKYTNQILSKIEKKNELE